MVAKISSLSEFPEEILARLFSLFADPKDAAALGCTSRLFRRIALGFLDSSFLDSYLQELKYLRCIEHKPLIARQLDPFCRLEERIHSRGRDGYHLYKRPETRFRDRVFVTDRYLVACRQRADLHVFATQVLDAVTNTTVPGALEIPCESIERVCVLEKNRLMYTIEKTIVIWNIATQEITNLQPLQQGHIFSPDEIKEPFPFLTTHRLCPSISSLSGERIVFAECESSGAREHLSAVVWNYKTDKRVNLNYSHPVNNRDCISMHVHDNRVLCYMRKVFFAGERQETRGALINIWDLDAPTTQPVYQLRDLTDALGSEKDRTPYFAIRGGTLIICNQMNGKTSTWNYALHPSADASDQDKIKQIRFAWYASVQSFILSPCQRWIIRAAESGRIEAQSLECTKTIISLREDYLFARQYCWRNTHYFDWSTDSPFVTIAGKILFPSRDGTRFCIWDSQNPKLPVFTPAFGKEEVTLHHPKIAPFKILGCTPPAEPPYCSFSNNICLWNGTIVFGYSDQRLLLFNIETT